MCLKIAMWQYYEVLYMKVFHLYFSHVETSTTDESFTRDSVKLERKKSFTGDYPVFWQQTEQQRNGWYLEQVRDHCGLVQQETELQETHLNGLDQREPGQLTESSGLVQQENTEINRDHQEPNVDTFSTEPSTPQSATHSPNKSPTKVRVGKSNMCEVGYEDKCM